MMRVDIDKIEDHEKYELMLKSFWLWSRTIAIDYVQSHGTENVFDYLSKATGEMAGKVGKRLIALNNLNNSLEDAMKLAAYYYNELWGSKDGYAVVKNTTEGQYIFPTCAWYDKLFSIAKMPCDQNCQHECTQVMSALSKEIEVSVIKARSKGDNQCIFRISLKR